MKGLDREAIGASDLAGIDWPVQPLNNNILLQNQEGYKDVAAETGIDYDVEGAKSDLDALGWTAGADGIREKDGKKLEVKFSQLSGVAVSENEALQAQNMLKEIGVKVDIVDVPIAKFQDGIAALQPRVRHRCLQLDRDSVPVPGHQPDLRHRLGQQLLAAVRTGDRCERQGAGLRDRCRQARSSSPTRRRRSSGRT